MRAISLCFVCRAYLLILRIGDCTLKRISIPLPSVVALFVSLLTIFALLLLPLLIVLQRLRSQQLLISGAPGERFSSTRSDHLSALGALTTTPLRLT